MMEYFKKWLVLPLSAGALMLLSGCETQVDEDDIEIIGSPRQNLYIDSPFEYQFGVAGGDGTFQYRYVQNPPIDEFEDTDVDRDSDNPVSFEIENSNGAKPSFWIRGVPQLEEGADFDAFTSLRTRYRLEVTDGKSTAYRDFDFSLNKNALEIGNGTILVSEGTASSAAANLKAIKTSQIEVNGFSDVCDEETERTYAPYVSESGQTIYPLTTRIDLDAPVASDVELFYRVFSSYDETRPENDPRNVGFARPDVDFVEFAERSVVFKRGVQVCLIELDLLDDANIEGQEIFFVEFYARGEGALVDFINARAEITISDNEPSVSMETAQATLSEGDVFTHRVEIGNEADYPIQLTLSLNEDESSVEFDDYRLVPDDGVLTFLPGQKEASFSIELLKNDDGAVLEKDEFLTFNLGVEEVFELEPIKISINEWPANEDIANEIVASSADQERAVSFAADKYSGIYALVERTDGNGFIDTLIKPYDRSGQATSIAGGSPFVFEQDGKNIRPIGIGLSESAERDYLAVVVQVTDLVAGVHYGGEDFVVKVFTRAGEEEFEEFTTRQYGSDSDDIVLGTRIATSGELVVFGRTQGEEFEGDAGDQINSGGNDGFVYYIELADNEKVWASLIGSVDEDETVAVSDGRNQLLTLNQRETTNTAGFIRPLTTAGQVSQDTDDIVLSTGLDDRYTAIDRNNRGDFLVLSETERAFDSTVPSNFTQGVSLLRLKPEGDIADEIRIDSGGDDIAAKMVQFSSQEFLLVSGETDGELVDGDAKDVGTNDAFVASYSVAEDDGKLSESKITQFGTLGVDQIIEVKEVHDRKALVLWSEDSSSPGNTIYRLSPFSPEGDKLTNDPN